MAGRHAAGRGRHRVTETSDYVAMMKRIILGYGRRIGQDPVALGHLRELEHTLRDAVNLGCYLANTREDIVPRPYSLAEQARLMGVTRQSVHARVQAGRVVAFQLGEGPAVRVGDVRAERAAVLAASGVPDRTGSDREKTAAPQ